MGSPGGSRHELGPFRASACNYLAALPGEGPSRWARLVQTLLPELASVRRALTQGLREPAHLSPGQRPVLQVWAGQFSLPGRIPPGAPGSACLFSPRHTGRPSRPVICFPRESGPEAALWMRTSRTRCWREGARAHRGAGRPRWFGL